MVQTGEVAPEATREDDPDSREPRDRRLRLIGLGADLLAILLCAWYATRMSRGMDINFDQLNYHYYYSWLLFHGGPHQVDPEPFTNRYVNPLPQLPWFFLDSVLPPRACAGAIAALAGVNLAVVRRITMVVLEGSVRPAARLALGISAMAVAGVAAVFRLSLGTSLSDVILAIPVLCGLLALLVGARPDVGPRGRFWWPALAGLLVGAAVGAKLTMGPFVLALVVATGVLAWSLRSFRPVLGLAVGGVVGIAASGGWWFVSVYDATGNPMFPYYNNIFGSDLWPHEAFRDETYGPRSAIDAAKYPFYMFDGTDRLLEYHLRDPRWVLLEVLVLAAVVLALVQLRRRGRTAVRPPLAGVLVGTFFVVAGLAWLAQFGIARYAVPAELLTGTLIVVLIVFLARRPLPAAVVAVVVALVMAPFVQGHTAHREFKPDRYGVHDAVLKAIPPGSVVLVDGFSAPSGFLLRYVPDTSRRHLVHPWFYGSPLLEKLKREQIATAPRIYVIKAGWWLNQPAAAGFEKAVGVHVLPETCKRIPNNIGPRKLCVGVWTG